MSGSNGGGPIGLDLDELDSLDTVELDVRHPVTDEPTGWCLTFAGPGHRRTIDMANERLRRQQREERERELAKANGHKWKGDDKSPDDIRAETVAFVADRIIAWSPDPTVGGAPLPHSRDAARRLLGDPKKGWLFQQCFDFIKVEENFMRRSATDSSLSPSINSGSSSVTSTVAHTAST